MITGPFQIASYANRGHLPCAQIQNVIQIQVTESNLNQRSISRRVKLCQKKMGVSVKLVVIAVTFSVQFFAIDAAEQCIKGKFHKLSPGPENKDYVECHPWQNKTCCTASFTKEFKANQTRNLYGHDWHRCKKLSTSCERFWMNQVM